MEYSALKVSTSCCRVVRSSHLCHSVLGARKGHSHLVESSGMISILIQGKQSVHSRKKIPKTYLSIQNPPDLAEGVTDMQSRPASRRGPYWGVQ
jgi:hypothetical protein